MWQNPQRTQQSRQNGQGNMQAVSQSVNRPRGETEVMQLARKIKTEQGDKSAGYFLYAMKPYAAPGEISHIESILQLHAERDPSQSRQQAQGGNMNMLQLLMRMMQGGKPDPMTLMRMMNSG